MGTCKKRLAPLILVILVQFPALGAAVEGLDNVEVSGFLLGNFTGRTTGLKPEGEEGGDYILAEERLRLDIYAWPESIEASARVKVDFFHDAIADDFDLDLREGYFDYTIDAFDFRLGRQIVTWGVGDLVFINDVFPKDWMSFFSGRPLEYLKIGVDGFRARYSSKAINAELLVIPSFEPDNLPPSERFFLYDPFPMIPARDEEKPDADYENTELALRLYQRVGGFDVSAYAYQGFFRTPSMRLDNPRAPTMVTLFYPALSVYGASAQGSALDGIMSLEAGYYQSRDDEKGDGPAIPNSHWRFLVGYQRQLFPDFTLGVQYYGEIMEDYSEYEDSLPKGFPGQERYRDIITLRLTQLLEHQTLRLSLFTFYSPADNDYLFQPNISYNLSDELSAALGANVFGGEDDTTFLGQFDNNDNVYISIRYHF